MRGDIAEPSLQRDRLTDGLYVGDASSSVNILEKAFHLAVENKALTEKMKKAKLNDIEQAFRLGVLSKDEAEKLQVMEAAVAKVIAVDDFDAETLTGNQKD